MHTWWHCWLLVVTALYLAPCKTVHLADGSGQLSFLRHAVLLPLMLGCDSLVSEAAQNEAQCWPNAKI